MKSFLLRLEKLFSLNIKTFRFNFYYFPFRQAISFPVIVSSKVALLKMKGELFVEEPLYFGKIKIGYGDVGIFDKKYSRSIWEVAGIVEFKGVANIGHGSKISVGNGACLVIGNNFTISAESSIVAVKNISIGDDCLISWEVLIIDTDFHKIYNEAKEILNPSAAISLGDKIWVGARSLILKGARIPSNSVVAAGSIVTNKLEGENQVFAGSPAKAVKSSISWEQ